MLGLFPFSKNMNDINDISGVKPRSTIWNKPGNSCWKKKWCIVDVYMYLEKIVVVQNNASGRFQAPLRHNMAEILPIRRTTLSKQSIPIPHNAYIYVIINFINELSWI